VNERAEKKQVLSFGGVSKVFRSFLPRRRVTALSGLDMTVHSGEIVGLVGPNGSGKTTAFRLAAGLIAPDAGSISLFGERPGSRKARLLQGYMPEQPGVPETLTPAELLHFVGRVFGLKPAARERRLAELSELLALSPFLKRRMAGFSKGMIKRVGLAAALFNRPELILLDEPLEGVDPIGSAGVKEYLADYARKGGAVLVSSHILSDVETLCSSLVIVNDGHLILQGRKDEILALRGMVEVRCSGPDNEKLAAAIRDLVERSGGTVHSMGRPRENLESLFRRLIGPKGGGKVSEWA
jgi:ABC-2 type transport system ATP-binding protein